jgi:O-antigen ligase
MLALETERISVRIAAVSTALVFASVPLVTKALVSTWLVLVLPVGALLAVWALRSAGRAVVLGFGCVFLSVVGITVWIGLTQSTGGLVADALTQTRVALWREATAVMLEHPLTGVGPTRFQDVSSIARDDPDHRWAHAEFLQQGAEQGMMGMVLSISLFGCAIIALAARARTGPVEVLAAVAVVMLGVQGAVDYVFHFPAIPLAAAALAGVGMSRRRVSGQRANGDGTVGSR